MYQEELKYTKTHEWVQVFKNNIVRIGITEYIQQNLGKVLFVELPEVDDEHEQFDSIAVIEAENMLSDTLKSLFAVAENYPNLRASENFSKLQDELSDTENKIQAARRFYNGNVRDFNTKIQVFPNNIISNMLGFKKSEFFEAEGAERENVQVKF